MAEREPAIPLGKLAQGMGLQTVLLCAAGAALWHCSGRELSAFVDWSWLAALQGLLWGILPIGASLLALFTVILLPERGLYEVPAMVPVTVPADEVVYREVK